MVLTIAAGTSDRGSGSAELDHPHGVFVDDKYDLYVADCGNNRVQLFESGESVATTIVGGRLASVTNSLNCPTSITFDAQKYLFIIDSNNHRIVRFGTNGFHCVIGCRGGDPLLTQLSFPSSLSFDRSGNLFVTDTGNSRIQKFQYLQHSC
ncbi:unnamed protein product, partial [Adineta steineri]